MATLPDGNPFRRKEWQVALRHTTIRRFEPELPELRRWVPNTHLKIADGLEILGQKEVEHWSGNERNAKRYTNEPDPPWTWNHREEIPDFFTISENSEIEQTDEETAFQWWQGILPTLIAEWEEETAAYRRWRACLDLMRNRLSTGQSEAYILLETGKFEPVPEQIWRGKKGGHFLSSGVAQFYAHRGYSSSDHVRGPVLVQRDFLSEDKPENSGSRVSSNIAAIVDEDAFPYLAFMLKVAHSDLFEVSSRRVPKKTVEQWLRENWPSGLGDPTPTKISTMATFLRRPEDEKGGVHGKGPGQ